MRLSNLVQALVLLSPASSVASVTHSKKCLPVVDLGYTKHQALAYNSTTDVYKFSNIRYAQAPTGELRFRAPLAPVTNRTAIENGSQYRACPQAMPLWQASAYIPIGKYSSGSVPFSLEGWKKDIAAGQPPPGLLETMNDNVSEDCLFLDVHTPRRIFKRAAGGHQIDKGAPVLVWIHGGGYVLGSKTAHPTPYMNPDGIINQAEKFNQEGVIFVAINYRLGALGFLAGPEVRTDGALNAGLLDQRLALNWVQDNIYKFGGDPDRITVMGESAGGGSILFHMAAYGGHNGSAPFSQAIIQSPAAPPKSAVVEGSYAGFLKILGVENLSQARKLTEKEIIKANELQIGAAPAITYIYGPVTDNEIVSGDIGHIYNTGAFDQNVKVMASHNSFEGAFFFDPRVETEADFRAWIARSLAGLSSEDVGHLSNVLYPPQFDGSLGYVDQATRQMILYSEALVDCTFVLANEALHGNTFSYLFSVSPGFHIQDLKYTFDDHATATRAPIAKAVLQRALASYTVNGEPDIYGGGSFPRWKEERAVLNITETGGSVSKSRVNGTRCAWWHRTWDK
ncbi:acetylcholinesterase [Paramyrothecium foliicola]|nr:acetylcholinesterase [Paramyrothecium foliicola]